MFEKRATISISATFIVVEFAGTTNIAMIASMPRTYHAPISSN